MPSPSRPVGQVRIEEHDAKTECLGAQRDRRSDTPHSDNAEGLHRGAANQRILDVAPRGRRVGALRFMVQQQPAPQRQGQGYRMVRDFRGAIVRNIQDHDLPRGRGHPVEIIVTHPHATYRA
jgi:hypothetical protein